MVGGSSTGKARTFPTKPQQGYHLPLKMSRWRYRRSVPLTTISTRREPQPPQTSRAHQSGTVAMGSMRTEHPDTIY
jgi:hypothetical protein